MDLLQRSCDHDAQRWDVGTNQWICIACGWSYYDDRSLRIKLAVKYLAVAVLLLLIGAAVTFYLGIPSA